RHAAFVRDGDGFLVRDLGSLNGTYVGQDRVDEVRLHSGQEVQIGKYRLSYHPFHGTVWPDAGRRIAQAALVRRLPAQARAGARAAAWGLPRSRALDAALPRVRGRATARA